MYEGNLSRFAGVSERPQAKSQRSEGPAFAGQRGLPFCHVLAIVADW
jgi:hypothetical protein